MARLIQLYGHLDAEDFLKAGRPVEVQYVKPEARGRAPEPAQLTLA